MDSPCWVLLSLRAEESLAAEAFGGIQLEGAVLPSDIYDAQDLRILNGDVWQWWHSYPMVLDELKIYNTALASKQVSELYAEGKGAKAPELSAFRRDEKTDVPVASLSALDSLSLFRRDEKTDVPVAEDSKYEAKQFVKPEEKEPDELSK
jgi:hypothetical protein